ncbi:MAG: rhomboid family intramembrane serine protease [Puniceicoccales bacterium]
MKAERDFLREVGRYSSYTEAVEDGLLVLAMGEAYWMFPESEEYVLFVREEAEARVRREILEVAALRGSRRSWGLRRGDLQVQRVGFFSFAVYVLILVGIYWLQVEGWHSITAAGGSNSVAMVQGHEWWRAVTALTLHGDIGHLIGNLAAGVGFGFGLSRYLGAGWAWTLIVVCGALGNGLTAFLYYPQPHLSVGASTAIFGALGLLTGFGWSHSRQESRRSFLVPEWILPLLAGLTLLGMLGSGGERTDVMAHLSGFGLGLVMAVLFSLVPQALVMGKVRCWIGGVPVILVAAAWYLALS